MAIIPQMSLFTWKEIEILGDLDRLRLVLDYMPDEAFMQSLEKKRGKGRNDYPVRAMWNSILAGIVFQHESIEKLRRELSRNGQLREMCGFEG
ncbi:transposase, partial [Heyndrickxia coagulans]